jgi:peptidoglycan biosynthesis protein MviN/MurJ (putative lipid II flippase)
VPTLSTGIGMMANILCIQLINTPSPTDKLAIAYAFGAFMQFSVCAMLPMIRTARLKHPDIRAASKKILRSIWPLIFFGLISRAMPLMERSIATDLPSGSISHLSYASKIANILDTLIGFSLATVLLPELAKLASQNNIDALAKTYRKALALATNIAAPIGLLCIASAKEIVELLLQRGNFTAEDTRETAALLPLYVLGVLFSILGTVIGRFLYAQGKTLAFNIAGALVGLLYPICAIWLKPSMGLMALALAQAICSATGVLLGFGLVAKQTNPIDLAFLRSCLLALITFAIVTYYPAPTPQAHSIVKIMVQSLYCIAVYGMTWAISAPAFQDRK